MTVTQDRLNVQLARADELIRLQRDTQVMDLLLTLLRDRPDAAGRIHLLLARAHLVANRPGPAHEHALEAVAAAPDNATAHLLTGVALRSLGRLPEAEAALHQAAMILPGDPRPHCMLAQVLTDRGRVQEAYAAAGEALRLMPHEPMAHFSMGYALHDSNPAEARRAYETVLALDPHHTQAKHNLAGLAAERGDWRGASVGMADVLAAEPGQVLPLVMLDQRLVQTIGRSHWILVAVWLGYGIAAGMGAWPAFGVALAGPLLTVLMLRIGTKPIREALPGGGVRFLKGFPRREPLAAVWLLLVVAVPIPMLAGTISELSGALVDGRYLGVSSMALLVLGAILSWVRIPFAQARAKRLQRQNH